jgi:predicted RNase H-like nuclease (RuvC/YqgF family)
MTEEEKLAAEAAQKAANEAAAKKAAEEEAAKKAAEEEAARKAAEEGKPKITDSEAKLLKEVMEKKAKIKELSDAAEKLQEQLKSFEGIDPASVRDLLKQKQDEETKKLEAKGEWDRLKAQMNEQHQKALESLKSTLAEKDGLVGKLQKQIEELTIGNAFGTSKFIAEELALTPTKTRVLFGGHFEFKDGHVVAFDKPVGAAERTPLVDAKGDPLPFEAALKKLVESDNEKDSLFKAKIKPGAGSGTAGSGAPAGGSSDSAKPMKPLDKIAAGLAARMGSK